MGVGLGEQCILCSVLYELIRCTWHCQLCPQNPALRAETVIGEMRAHGAGMGDGATNCFF